MENISKSSEVKKKNPINRVSKDREYDYVERELKEFRMILDMVENDVLQNEYEIRAFISNQVERFGKLTGVVLKPAIEQLANALENMDEKTIDKIINKLQGSGLKGKFNFVK